MFGRITLLCLRSRFSLCSTLSCAAIAVVLVAVAEAQTTPCTLPTNTANVTTWHNDNCRTGWQESETALSPTGTNWSNFGLLWQWPLNNIYTNNYPSDETYAQPLAVGPISTGSCVNCTVVFVATEQDQLYAFRADSSSSTPIWRVDLPGNIPNGPWMPVDCGNFTPTCDGQGIIAPFIGVTGTPVISTSNNAMANVLYVVTAVSPVGEPPTDVHYFLHAIDITSGNELGTSGQAPIEISAIVPGNAPSTTCGSASTVGSPTISFDPLYHIQRAGLLLVTLKNSNVNTDIVYVAFAPIMGENENGWIFGYTFNTSSGFTQVASFVTTPYGTGGGVWESGAGLAAGINTNGDSNTYIYEIMHLTQG